MKYILLCLILVSTALKAEDMKQYLGDMVDEETDLEKSLKKAHGHEEEEDPYLQHNVSKRAEEIEEAQADSPFITGDAFKPKDFSQPLTEKEQVHSVGNEVLGSRDHERNYLEFKNSDLIKDLKHKGDKNLSFTFFKDDFSYKSNSNFDQTFRSDSSNQIEASDNGKKVFSIPLMLRFSGHELFMRTSWLRLGAGAGLGVGYNSGKGYFSNGLQSNANISLWTIPVDASLVAEIPVSFLKFSVFGGPSVLGLMQNRSDLPDGNKRKNLRQASLGYFAGAKVGISISELFPGVSYDYFGSYQVTRYYLTFEARTQSYSDFKQEDLSVSGTSFGAGFTFEYF